MESIIRSMDTEVVEGLCADEEACGPSRFNNGWTRLDSIVWRVLEELAKNPAEMGRVSARGLPRHLRDMSGAEAEDLGGSFSPVKEGRKPKNLAQARKRAKRCGRRTGSAGARA
jgi:hypothetical protein